MAKTLQKPTRCPACGGIMAAGESFRWHKVEKTRPSYGLGAGSGVLVKVETFRPGHVHNCYGAKVAAELDQIAREKIEAACVMAEQYGESREWIAEYRAKLMAEAGLVEQNPTEE